jgi:hypothetical protein
MLRFSLSLVAATQMLADANRTWAQESEEAAAEATEITIDVAEALAEETLAAIEAALAEAEGAGLAEAETALEKARAALEKARAERGGRGGAGARGASAGRGGSGGARGGGDGGRGVRGGRGGGGRAAGGASEGLLPGSQTMRIEDGRVIVTTNENRIITDENGMLTIELSPEMTAKQQANLKRYVDLRNWSGARKTIEVLIRASKKGWDEKEGDSYYHTNEYLPKSDDPMYQLLEKDVRFEMATEELVKRYNKASGEAKKASAEENIAEIIKKHFQVRQDLRQLEVEQLEKKLEKIREQIARRAELADAIIQRRVDQLTGRTSDLDWDVNGAAKASGRRRPSPVVFDASSPGRHSYNITAPVPIIDLKPVHPIAPPLPAEVPVAPHAEVHEISVELEVE